MSARDSSVTRPWDPGPIPLSTDARRRALPLRVEFARQISQWRVRGVFLILAFLPIVIRLAFLIGGGRPPEPGRFDLAAFAQASGTTFTTFVLAITAGFLLTLVVSLLFGDMIAGEASRSTLKYLLTIPVGRTRLLFVKVIVSSTLLVLGVVILTGMSLLVGIFSFGFGGIQVPAGPELDLGESLLRIAAAVALICVHLAWAGALGTLLTVVTDAHLAAAGGVVVATIVSSILQNIEDLGDIRFFLPTYHSDAFQQLFAARIDWAPVADSVLSALVYSLVFTVAAVWWFRRKNISS